MKEIQLNPSYSTVILLSSVNLGRMNFSSQGWPSIALQLHGNEYPCPQQDTMDSYGQGAKTGKTGCSGGTSYSHMSAQKRTDCFSTFTVSFCQLQISYTHTLCMPELHTGVISHSAFSLCSQYILKSNLLNHIFVGSLFYCLSSKAR